MTLEDRSDWLDRPLTTSGTQELMLALAICGLYLAVFPMAFAGIVIGYAVGVRWITGPIARGRLVGLLVLAPLLAALMTLS